MALNGSGLFNVDSTGQPVVSSTLISASVFNAFTADVATALSNAMYKDGQQTVTANIPMGGYKFTGLAAGANAGESVRYEQLAGSISQTFSAASIDLGHASDTTLSRVSAGVVAVEGVNILTTATGAALAGNASQAFSVATATADAHAVTALQYQNNALRYVGTSGTSTAYLVSIPIMSAYTDGMTIDIKPHVDCGASPTININSLGALAIKKVTPDGGLIVLAANDLIQYRNATITYSAAVGSFVLRDARAIPTAGTTGQVLTSQGAGAIPTWSTPATTTTLTTPSVLAASTLQSLAHGLGRVPNSITYSLIPQSTLHGWATTDEIFRWHGLAGGTEDHITIGADATNVMVLPGAAAGVSIVSRTTGSAVAVTLENFKIKVRVT